MERVLALGQHFLGSAANYYQWATLDCFLDHAAGYFDQLFVSRPFGRGHRRHPFLGAHRHRCRQSLYQRWHTLFTRLYLGDAQPHARGYCIDYGIIQ